MKSNDVLTASDINHMLYSKRVRRQRKNKTPQGSFVLIANGPELIREHRPIRVTDTGSYKVGKSKYSATKTARWVGGKSKTNPRFMPGDDNVVAYLRKF